MASRFPLEELGNSSPSRRVPKQNFHIFQLYIYFVISRRLIFVIFCCLIYTAIIKLMKEIIVHGFSLGKKL